MLPARAARARLLPVLVLGTALAQPARAQQDPSLAGLSVAGGADAQSPADGAGPSPPGPFPPGTRLPGGGVPPGASTVDRRELNALNAQTLGQALAYTPEASVDANIYDPLGSGVDIRGFDTTYNATYRDGLLQSAANLAIPRVEPYGVESIDVLRGPAAGVYGFNAPAGILNVATKRPRFEPFGEVQLQAGNYDRYQGNFDFGGPVEGSDGTMAYRLTGVLRRAGTFIPGGRDDRAYLAPALAWKPDADTTLTVLAEYMTFRLPSNPSYVYYRGYDVTRFYQGDPAFGTYAQDQYRIGYAFEHRFSPDLIARQNLRYAALSNDFSAVYTFYNDDEGFRRGVPAIPRNKAEYRSNLASFALDNQVEGHLGTGPVAHTVTAGVAYLRYDIESRAGFGDFPADLTLNLSAPGYGSRAIAPPPLAARAGQSLAQAGLYLQERAAWGPLVLTLAGQGTHLSTDTLAVSDAAAGRPPALVASRRQDYAAFTYRVGLDYLLTPDIVPYASYATTFTPQPGYFSGVPLAPVYGDRLDAGLRFAIPGADVKGSVSGFSIDQSFTGTSDRAQVFYQSAPGSVLSRGFEMEMTANVAAGTSLTLAYRRLEFRYTNQTVALPLGASQVMAQSLERNVAQVDGNFVSGIPGDTFNAFATYLFPVSSPLSGLTLGGGVRFQGTSFADDRNLVRNPTATLFDAVAAYDLAALDPRYRGLRAQINAFNVFDRAYTVCQTVFCYRGTPATVIGSLVYRW